jgi:integrase
MATLELRPTSKWWYGRWTENGKIIVRNLDVQVEGRRPTPDNEEGDRRFRLSRETADAKLKQLARDAGTRKHVEGIAQAIHEARTGHRVGSIPISGIIEAWRAIPRRRQQLSPSYIAGARGVFNRFVSFMAARSPDTTDMSGVTHEMAQAFMASERARGVSGRTFNAALSLLKGCFQSLRRQAGIVDNPFEGIVGQDENTVHRIPFTPEELRAILEAATDDAFCRPLVVTGICTAMRRGDVCQLRWADVDMESRFITVDTSKTGARVSIPMFNMLYDELAALPRTSEFCFPEQAAMYQSRPDAIGNRLNRVFAAAGFVDTDDFDEAEGSKAPASEILSESEMLQRGRDKLLACTGFTNKVRTNLLRVFELYMAGGTLGAIARELKMSRGSVSTYYKRIEQTVGFTVVRDRRPHTNVKTRAPVHAKRKGLTKVNQHGFHAFRATWVTLALTAGVPVDLVRKVTGHTVTETVLTHYFQPGREDFRRTLQTAMPALLTDGAKSRDEQIREIVEGMTAKTCKKDRERLLELLGEAGMSRN